MPGTVRSGRTSPRDKVVALRAIQQMGNEARTAFTWVIEHCPKGL